MAWNYTKTLTIVAFAQMALRLPLTFIIDAKPFVSSGVFWVGVNLVLILPIIGAVFDLISRARRRRRIEATRGATDMTVISTSREYLR